MAFKRVIAVLTVLNGHLVKSYGYDYYRPAGSLHTALKEVDNWGVDEILVLDISRRGSIDPLIVREIRESRVSSPIIYGGGIRGICDIQTLLGAGCERFILETLYLASPDTVKRISNLVGGQALILSVPLVSRADQGLFLRAPSTSGGSTLIALDRIAESVATSPASEIMVIDVAAEGYSGAFGLTSSCRIELIEASKGIIWFGGIDGAIADRLLARRSTVGVAFGNVCTEKELAILRLRRGMTKRAQQRYLRRLRL